MKNLGKIVESRKGFGSHTKGQDGYGGGQKSRTVFKGSFFIPSLKKDLKILKNIEVGDAIGIHWAEYCPGKGWIISLAHWSDAPRKDIDISQVKKYKKEEIA